METFILDKYLSKFVLRILHIHCNRYLKSKLYRYYWKYFREPIGKIICSIVGHKWSPITGLQFWTKDNKYKRCKICNKIQKIE